MRSRLLSLLVVPALLAAGCGGATPSSAENFEGERRAVAETVEDLQRAAQRDEADRICRDFITAQLREQIAQGGQNCSEELEKAITDADAFELEVEDVTVSGSTATAQVRGDGRPEDVVRELELTREGGRWRISSFGGAA